MNTPKVSIITVCYNSQATIEETITSVLEQDYANLEYIIIDGQSQDNTLAIIDKYKNKITKIISEPDQGIYDAMNKGIKLANGEIIGLLNSDDLYKDKQTITKIVEHFQSSQADLVYADVSYISKNDKNKPSRYWQSGQANLKKINSGWIMPHPATFIKKTIYDQYGLFNPNFKLAGDYELLLRFVKKYKIKTSYLNIVATYMRQGGQSRRRYLGWQELKKAWRTNGYQVPPFFILRRIISKLPQLIKRAPK
jgi:glycosyltransferase involved in cell wall biosynthesis